MRAVIFSPPARVNTLIKLAVSLLLSLSAIQVYGADAGERRKLVPDDFYRVQDVSDPQVSPDGLWVAYVVTTNERELSEQNRQHLSEVETALGASMTNAAERQEKLIRQSENLLKEMQIALVEAAAARPSPEGRCL